MPTFAKLTGAILFAALAWYVSEMVKARLPDTLSGGRIAEVNAAFGGLLGWRILGRHGGGGFADGIGLGLTTGAATVILCLFTWAGYEMITRSMDLFYDGPMEALTAMMELVLEFGLLLNHTEIIATLLAGSVAAGILVQPLARRQM